MLDNSPHLWRKVLAPEQATAAGAVACVIAARLRSCEQVQAAAVVAERQSTVPYSVYWLPYSVAQGWAGTAVMCAQLAACFPDEGWDRVGHQYLALAAQGTEGYVHPATGLWTGLSGLAFAAWSLSKHGLRYRKLLAAIDEVLLPQLPGLARHLAEQNGVPVSLYDLISGLAGVGAYLLARRNHPDSAAALQTVLQSLTVLIRRKADLPAWHSPASMLDESMLQQFPGGNLNCGLAHGISGPLALLALARCAGLLLEDMDEAIDCAASWLAQHYLEDAWGVNWPTAVPLGESQATLAYSRSAWCYGGPGVARALWLAGQALNQAHYCDLAVRAMEAVYRRPLPERRLDSPTFCHGVAGLLQVTLRFAHDTGLPRFSEAACALSTQLLALYEPESLLGYRSVEKAGKRIDQPGLLDGAPGVALVLLAAATDVEPTWDRLFLLA
jgi:hypothetical protein